MTKCILGIDAAWTTGQPSGVALLHGSDREWRVVAVAPSYESFLSLASGSPVDWAARPMGSAPDPGALLRAARALAGCDVSIAAIDMPIAKRPFSGRRAADSAVSRRFGDRWCAAHSPTASRPGALGAQFAVDLMSAGMPLATSRADVEVGSCSVEVYPHPALLTLVGAPRRVPYKVSRSSKYWPGSSIPDRIARLLSAFHQIHAALTDHLGPLPITLPTAGEVSSLATLKRHEDALDALVCAWVGALVLSGDAEPLGDESAAVWVPRDQVVIETTR